MELNFFVYLVLHIKKENSMRIKKYYSLGVCILSVIFVQNVSAAFLDGAETLKERAPFVQRDRFDDFLMDANQRGYKYFSEVIKLVKKKDEKEFKIVLKKAKDSFILAIDQSPNSVSYNGLIKVLLLDFDYKQADLWLKKALALDANNIDTRYLQARLFIITNRISDAKVVLQKILASNGGYKLAFFSLAEIAVKEKKYSVAEQYYRGLLLLGEASVSVYTNLAGLLAIQNKTQEAISILLQGYEYFKDSTNDAVNIAVALSKQYVHNNTPEKALQLSRSIFESRVDSMAAMGLYLDMLVINKKEAKAEAILLDRVSKNKGDISSRLKLIVLLSEKKTNKAKVVALFEDVISLNKRTPGIYNAYVRFLIGNKAFGDANGLIVRARKQFPNAGFTDILMAELSVAQGDMESVAKYYLSAYKKSKDSNLLVKVVQSLILIDQKSAAIKLLSQEISINDSSSARILLAGIYFSDKDMDRAEQQYRKVLSKNAYHYIALNDLAWLLSQINRDKEALVYAEKAYLMAPTSDDIKNTYSTILNHLGYTEKAAEILSK